MHINKTLNDLKAISLYMLYMDGHVWHHFRVSGIQIHYTANLLVNCAFLYEDEIINSIIIIITCFLFLSVQALRPAFLS